jgi:hypothetical protein
VDELTGNTKELPGIGAVKVDDGKLIIYCAPAEDILSPPIHYDLYYLSLSGLNQDTTTDIRPAGSKVSTAREY